MGDITKVKFETLGNDDAVRKEATAHRNLSYNEKRGMSSNI